MGWRRLIALSAFVLPAAVAAGTPAPKSVPDSLLRDLAGMTDLSSVSQSPDGRWIAFRAETPSVSDDRVTLRWMIVRSEGSSTPRVLADGGAPIWTGAGTIDRQAPLWSADSRFLYYRRLVGAASQLWRTDIVSGRSEARVRDPADVRRFRLADDGSAIIYEVEGADRSDILRAERDEGRSGVHIDQHIDPAQSLTAAVERYGRLASERLTNPWFTRTGVLGDRPPRVYRLGVGGGARRQKLLSFEGPTSEPMSDNQHDRIRAPTGDRAFVTDWGDRSSVGWVQAGSAATAAKICGTAICHGAVAIGWGKAPGELLILRRNRDQRAALLRWRPTAGAPVLVADTLALDSSAETGCAIGHGRLVCVEADGDIPPRLIVIDAGSGRSRTIYDPNRRLAERLPGGARWIHWNLADGREVWGQFLPAAGATPAPLVVHYYDCRGFLKGGTGDEWPFQAFSRDGISVLCIQPVADPQADSGDNQAAYRTGLAAVSSAIDVLDSKGLIDRHRIGMAGLSFGSEVAIYVAMHTHLLAALSIASPTLDAGTYYYFNALPGRDFSAMIKDAWGLDDPDREPGPWQKLSAASNIDAFDAPMLIQIPEQEFRFNMRLYSRLLAAGRAVDMYAFPNERHFIASPARRLKIYRRNLDWFRFWLGRDLAPPPAVADRLSLWRRSQATADR